MSDLIDRKQALKDYQDKLCEAVSCVDCPFCIDRLYGGCKVEKYLINLPSAEKTGKWLKTGQSLVDPRKFRNFFCPICGVELDPHIRVAPNYCPNCGARMEG